MLDVTPDDTFSDLNTNGLIGLISLPMCIRPAHQHAAAAMSHLAALASEHPDAQIALTGVDVTDRATVLQFDVMYGTPEEVRAAAPRTVAALTFIRAVLTSLHRHDPSFWHATVPASAAAHRLQAMLRGEQPVGAPAVTSLAAALV